ncbi:MAG: MTH1187 family thiamine-binding protein [Candidatus Aminicenantes bacterium]|nr:MTH1187 family thiamine-binding protein [Candidatus Aminicenantes bacterium]
MIAEFSVVPVGKGEELAELVAGVVDIIDRSGLPYQLTAMGTLVEGEWDDVLALIKECHFKMRRRGARVLTRISIDDRENAVDRLTGKVRDVEKVLGRELRK